MSNRKFNSRVLSDLQMERKKETGWKFVLWLNKLVDYVKNADALREVEID